jgi:hypothetical protein
VVRKKEKGRRGDSYSSREVVKVKRLEESYVGLGKKREEGLEGK